MSEGRKQVNRQSALVFVAVLLLFSVGMGLVASRRYARSQNYLRSEYRRMLRRGKALSAEQCVDEVLGFRRNCRTLKSLCDAFAPRLMAACFSGGDRSRYCASLPADTVRTRFSYLRCKRRGVDRRTRKACYGAYRLIAATCRRYRTDKS
jgi:hypothetical protein